MWFHSKCLQYLPVVINAHSIKSLQAKFDLVCAGLALYFSTGIPCFTFKLLI